jgi:hypothetical protein
MSPHLLSSAIYFSSARACSVAAQLLYPPSHPADALVEDDDTPRRRREVSRSVDSYPDMDERSFVCPYDFCRRPFKRLEHLKRHVRTHTQERPFECPTCSRGFSRQDNLIQHMRTHGKGNTPQPGGEDAERRTRDWAANGPGRWATASPVGGPYQLPK